jgi:hypothetical protein
LDGLLPRDLVAAAYDVFRELVILPGSIFAPHKDLANGILARRLGGYLPDPAAEFIVHFLNVLVPRLPLAVPRRGGFEIWSGLTMRGGAKAYLHVDNDEALRRTTGLVRSPLFGAIFHLGPASGLRGGETLFDMGRMPPAAPPARFAFEPWERILARSAAPLIVPQKAGRLILFSGDLPHAVAPIQRCAKSKPRVALLANLWPRRISSVQRGVGSRVLSQASARR